MVLETQRLILDAWQPHDWLALRPIATDPAVMRYITGGAPWSDEQIRSFVARQIAAYTARGFCRWRLTTKPGGEMIGFCGVGYWRNGPDPEIGWWLARAQWGRGLATEAARAALQHAFNATSLDRIMSVAMTGNAASIRIMRKLGLAFDGEFENQGFRLVRYAITRHDFAKMRSAPPPA
ncbi:MAG TPA: GNAT family N-acetyltransferase [Bryobacteraceae bacterium]|nr:GNAT family N-acetyltransferase [Bryobacteraceae bacterium]